MEKESAPKKQFRLKKKSFFISLSVFVLLILVAIGVIMLLQRGREERLEMEGQYNKLLEYCGEGDGDTLECKVLLGDFYDSDDGQKDCMEIVLPVADVEVREISLCFKKGVVDWENPYDDYSRYIPVLMVIEGYREFPRISVVNMAVLEDEEGYGLARELYEEGSTPFTIWTKEDKLEKERGYDVILLPAEDDSDPVPSGLSIRKGRILSYDIVDENIRLEIEAFTLGGVSRFSVESREFYIGDRKTWEKTLVTPSSNVGDLDLDLNYRVNFFLSDPSSFSIEFIEEQLLLLVEGKDNELLFNSLSVVYEE